MLRNPFVNPPGEFWGFRVALISVALLRFATSYCERALCLASRMVELFLSQGEAPRKPSTTSRAQRIYSNLRNRPSGTAYRVARHDSKGNPTYCSASEA